jgi:two-component system chemotaxis response regulator CheB
MGNDGSAGALEIKKQGGMVFAESPETAIVYGMPREVSECGAADRSVALDMMAKEITRTVVPKDDNIVASTGRIEQAGKK